MTQEIHMFAAQATARQGNPRYPIRTRHALLVFIRQPVDTEYDWDNTIKIVADLGWEDVIIGKAGKAGLEPTATDDLLKNAHREAAEKGSSVIVYAEPIGAA